LNKKNNERASSSQPTETHISIPPVVEQAPDVVAPDNPCEFYDISSEAAEEDIIIIPEGAEDDEEDKFIHDQEQFESFHSLYMMGLIETEENYMKGITAYSTFKKIEKQLCREEAIFESLKNCGIRVMMFDEYIYKRWRNNDPMLMSLLMHENVVFLYQRMKMDYNKGDVQFVVKGIRDVSLLFYDQIGQHIVAKCLPAINVVDGFFLNIRHKGPRQCKLCFEKGTRRTIECARCRQRICPPCFYQLRMTTWCPFCRYSLYEHIMGNIKKFGIDSLVFDI
jgi:hypothetical protein